jgi:DEAD/DEAH box helicase domain-containing protein
MPIGACSAATSRTCCAGCSASAGTTDPTRCSSARRRPSPTRSELAERLAERPFELVSESGAPRGEKFFLFVNPPVVNRELGIRRSYIAEAGAIAGEFLRRNLQVIVFCQSRLHRDPDDLPEGGFRQRAGHAGAMRGYRGRVPAASAAARSSGPARGRQVRAVVSTNALELGIDIGALDVAVMAGYPGTIAATWQRAGRAGRRASRSAAVMVASQRAHRPVRGAAPVVLLRRLARARARQPRQPAHPRRSREVRRVRAAVRRRRALRPRGRAGSARVLAGGRLVHRSEATRRGRPAPAVALDERLVSRRCREPALDLVRQLRGRGHHGRRLARDRRDRFHERPLHAPREGDLHRGGPPLPGRAARLRGTEGVRPRRWTATTTPTRSTTRRVTPLDVSSRRACPAQRRGGGHVHGEVHVVSRVVGFKKIKFHTNENVGSGELDLPEQQMHTTAYWLTVPPRVMEALPFARRPARRRGRALGSR